MEFSQTSLVESGLTGDLRVRILGWIWFLLAPLVISILFLLVPYYDPKLLFVVAFLLY